MAALPASLISYGCKVADEVSPSDDGAVGEVLEPGRKVESGPWEAPYGRQDA
jgi:hypothetical protein